MAKRKRVDEPETYSRQAPQQASMSSGGSKSTNFKSSSGFKGRRPTSDGRDLSTVIPPSQGNVKERLQFKPLLPGKKKPSGENWTKFKSASPMGAVRSDDAVGANRSGRMQIKGVKDPYDNVNAEEQRYAKQCLAEDGMIKDRDALADRATESYNEHLYEEVVDKQTGKRSLLFRSDIFDRI